MKPTKRQLLVTQLRQALYLAENPKETQFEFGIMGTTFEFVED